MGFEVQEVVLERKEDAVGEIGEFAVESGRFGVGFAGFDVVVLRPGAGSIVAPTRRRGCVVIDCVCGYSGG